MMEHTNASSWQPVKNLNGNNFWMFGYHQKNYSASFSCGIEEGVGGGMRRYNNNRKVYEIVKKGIDQFHQFLFHQSNFWHARRDSNPRPTDSKSGALSS